MGSCLVLPAGLEIGWFRYKSSVKIGAPSGHQIVNKVIIQSGRYAALARATKSLIRVQMFPSF